MDKNDNPIYLNYLIIDSSPFRLRYCSATFLPSQQPLFVAQLKALMGRNHRVDSFVDYSVYKADILVESYTSLREADIGPLLSEPLPEIARLSQHWPQGFDPGLIHVLLGNPLGEPERKSTIPSAVEPNVNIPNTEADDNEAAQLEVIKSLAKYSTSSLASIVNYKKYQENPHHRILSGRPADATGLPIGLYHSIFDSFQKRINSTPPDVTPKQLTDTLRLITASQNIYAKEPGAQGRVEALAPILDSLLGCSIGMYETKGTKSDGSILSRNGAYCMVMEIKNEIGTGGSDPSIQGAIEFAKYWSQVKFKVSFHRWELRSELRLQERLQWLREQCCCPTFILAIAGPWACILGGVMVKHPVVQPLAVFSIANNPSVSVIYRHPG
ncbi:hypothetical protein OPQ81_008705 [Rhizoctonia solani]|nr:hypothetical protein OPQ81_008705 [Rhizoctonia solani]